MPGTTDTVKAKLTPGEFVVRKEAVDMIGVPMLNRLNNMPEEGGHSAIDNIIDMATMANMKMMYGGGMVKPNYAGGGMVQQYGHGGSVDKMMGYAEGGQLKSVPQDNPGLGKLPEMVRNRMGYMQMGGMVDNSLMGMAGYKRGGYVSEKEKRFPMGMKFKRYENGGEATLDEFEKNYAEAIMSMKRAQAASDMASEKRKGLELLYGNLDFDDSMLLPDAPATPEKDILRAILNQALDKNVVRPLSSDELMQLMPPKKKQYLVPRSDRKFDWRNMQNGGEVDPLGIDKRQQMGAKAYPGGVGPVNDDPLGIDQRQANPDMYQGSMISPEFRPNPTIMLKQQEQLLQSQIEDSIQTKAMKTLQLLKLKGLLNQGERIENPSPMFDSRDNMMRIRDSLRLDDIRRNTI